MPALTTADAYQLFHEGTKALAQVEAAGIRIDRAYLEKASKRVGKLRQQLRQELQSDKVWRTWRKVYKDKANLTSRSQLADILFKHLGYSCSLYTATHQPSAEEEHLQTVDLPFVTKYLEMTKLDKVQGTYLTGIAREVDSNGYLHPFFSLAGGTADDEEKGGARSYRSSSRSPNFQNFPIRNKRQGKIIRSCFIPRPGQVILEVDYGAIEVRINACYSQDPALVAEVEDHDRDMHRDMAAVCYMLDFTGWQKDEFKNLRYCAKNKFVFPQFYGSVYFQCAPALWDAIDKMSLVTREGLSVKQHLANQGITSLGACDCQRKPKPGTFEHHIYKAEQKFWGERFPVHYAWRERWWKAYRQQGYFDLLTGFRVYGVYKKNEATNIPVQGAAFHCLLWSLIKLQKYLNKHKCQTRIVGQIHDSMLLDGPREEIVSLLPVIKKIMTEDIRQAWPWIIVPLEIEADITPVDGSWHDKAPIKIPA